MKKNEVILLVSVLFFVVLAGVGIYTIYQKKYPHTSLIPMKSNTSTVEKSVWEWNFPDKLSEDDATKTFTQLQSAGVTTIYLSMNDLVDIAEEKDPQKKAAELQKSTDEIRSYVTLAHEHGISIHALFGNKNWSDPSFLYLTDLAIDTVFSYNQTAPTEAQIQGIHFDIEPFSLPEFEEDKPKVLTQYLATIVHITQGTQARLKDQPTQPKLVLGFDIPYWLDGKTQNVPEIDWKGSHQFPLYSLIDLLRSYPKSEIVVMAYRDTALGENGSIALAQDEVLYASDTAPSVNVLVGIELNNEEPSSISFYNKNVNDLNTSITQISEAFQNKPSFKGVAIHELTSYQKKLLE